MSLSNLLSFIPDEALNSFINDGINSIDSIIMSAIKYLQALEQLLIAHHLHNKDLLCIQSLSILYIVQVSNKITSLYTAVSNFALLKSLKKEECTNQSINSTTLSQESTNTRIPLFL